MKPSPAREGLRERKKQQTFQQLRHVAFELFEQQGFEATTIEEIAARANVSPRTVYRYFGTKHDLVIADLNDLHRRVLELLADRPANEPPLVAACTATILACYEFDNELTARSFELILSDTTLNARALELRWQWMIKVGLELARRAGHKQPEPSEKVASGTSLGIMDGALRSWSASRRRSSLPDVMREMVDTIWQLTDAPNPAATAAPAGDAGQVGPAP